MNRLHLTLHDMFRPARVSGCLVVAALLAAPAMSQAHVHPGGSFYPTGNNSFPFQRIDAAAAAVIAAGSTAPLELAAGNYPDTGVLDTPPGTTMTLTTAGGSARIGYTANHQEFTVSIYTMNAHLFGAGSTQGELCPCLPTVGEFAPGAVLPGSAPMSYSSERPDAIADYMLAELQEYDVICIQEAWDPTEAQYIHNRLGGGGGPWPYVAYGGQADPWLTLLPFPVPPVATGCLNSGLWILSKHPISNIAQGKFLNETLFINGGESPSTKGWLECTVLIEDGGFNYSIQIFTTHTEAVDLAVRYAQISQLFDRTNIFRQLAPDTPMFVCGDFNIAQTSTDCVASICAEYNLFKDLYGNLFNDVHPNVESWNGIPDSAKYTNTQTNDLAQLFDPGDPSSRLDYILYQRHALQDDHFAIIPNEAFVDFWSGAPSWSGTETDAGTCSSTAFPSSTDLSDHQGVAAEFTIYFQ